MLDHGYTDFYRERYKKKPDWFSTNGDIFAVGSSTMNPFPPLIAKWQAKFPIQEFEQGIRPVEPLLRPSNQW